MVKKRIISIITTAAMAAAFGTALAYGGLAGVSAGNETEVNIVSKLTCETVMAAESSTTGGVLIERLMEIM